MYVWAQCVGPIILRLLLCQFRLLQVPLGGLLKGIAGAQHTGLVPGAGGDLQPDRQVLFGKAAWDADRGQAGQIER